MDRIVLNISGTKFEVTKTLLREYPSTRLGKAVISGDGVARQELYFDRPSSAFEAILTFYQTKKLHIPASMCPNAFKDELEFWEISYELLDKCCMYTFIQFMEKHTTRLEFQTMKNTTKPMKSIGSDYLAVKNRIWNILDHREVTWISKLYFTIAITCVILSIALNTISTIPQFRRNPTLCEKFKYLSFKDDVNHMVATNSKSIDCNDLQESLNTDESYMYYMDPTFYDDDDAGVSETTENPSEKSSNVKGNESKVDDKNQISKNLSEAVKNAFEREHPGVTLKSNEFIVFDYFFTVFFSIEFIMRLIVCPSFKRFMLSAYTGIEVLILIGTYTEIVLRMTSVKHFYSQERSIELFDFVKFFRILRLLRYCQNLAVVRVLKFSVCNNVKDLLMLFFNISFIVLVFANLLYLTEKADNIRSIPDGWWLGLVTITTVGFGDMFPKTVAGKIACSACALFGILTLALVTSIFVETFMTLYGVAHMETILTTDRRKWWRRVKANISDHDGINIKP